MLPVINLGRAAIQTRGLVFLIGFWLALWLAERLAARRGVEGDAIWNFGVLGLASAVLGARLAYALEHLDIYTREPQALLSLSLQSMAWAPGVLVGLLAGLLYLRREGVRLADAADILAAPAAFLWAAAGLGALLSGDAYGRLTTMPWGVVLWDGYRHPVQIYELLAGVVVGTLLLAFWPRAPYRGWIALVGAALFATARLLVEGFRGDPAVLAGGLRVAQLWSLGLAVVVLWTLYQAQLRLERGTQAHEQEMNREEVVETGGDDGLALSEQVGGIQ